MYLMFYKAHAFNGDLSRWDTSNVTTMMFMFSSARVFNGDLSRWDTSNVTNMAGMFRDARAFNGDLSRWNVSNVTDRLNIFYNCPIINVNKPYAFQNILQTIGKKNKTNSKKKKLQKKYK